jgi:hypothetical protein
MVFVRPLGQFHQRNVGKDVYCTPHIHVAEGSGDTILLNDKKYMMIV